LLGRVSDVRVDATGVRATCRQEAVLDVLFDGRRILSFWLHRDGVKDGSFSAREVAEAFVAAVERGRGLNAFLVETPEHALAAADAADRARTAGTLMNFASS